MRCQFLAGAPAGDSICDSESQAATMHYEERVRAECLALLCIDIRREVTASVGT